MDDAFIVVVVAVSLLALAGAVILLATSGGTYDGVGGLPASAVRPETAAERDEEIRQLLADRNERRAARGEPLLDLGELRASADPELAAEVRRHVEARNERRVARGQPPLDVEAEVARRLRDAGG